MELELIRQPGSLHGVQVCVNCICYLYCNTLIVAHVGMALHAKNFT